MKRGFALVFGLVILAATPALAAARSCDRACLSGIMDQYLEHIVRHSPEGLPFASQVNARENLIAVKPGEGLWQKITAIRSKEYEFDPDHGEVISMGAVDADGRLASLTLRLKVVDRKITESEMDFDESGGPGPFDAENMLEPDVIWDASVPPERRSSREQLIQIADTYLTGIGKHDPTGVPFGHRCDRYESGLKMTNNAAAPHRGSSSATCSENLYTVTGQQPQERRYPVVDLERGVVVAFTFYPHADRDPQYVLYLTERFKVVDGKIRIIDAISHFTPWTPTPTAGFGNGP